MVIGKFVFFPFKVVYGHGPKNMELPPILFLFPHLILLDAKIIFFFFFFP